MSTNKRLRHVRAGLLLLTVMLSGCSHLETRSSDTDSRQVHSVTFTKSDSSHHDPFPAPIQTDDSWHMESATSPVRKYDAFLTAHGPVLITGAEDKEIISLDASTGSVNWRLTMSTGIGAEERAANTPQTWASTQEAVVSPHGKYLVIRTHSYLNPEDSENIGDQRVGITVLDTKTGDTIRTVEISGMVLGQALTNDSLAVETAQNYYPADTGIITVFSLSKAQAEPTSFRSDQWLIGASPESLLMSQELPSRDGSGASWPYAITRINTAGEELGTVIGVRGLHPGGWIDRFKDPEAAAEI